jgi:glycosyltransferase involved in cell wall biosynthesis
MAVDRRQAGLMDADLRLPDRPLVCVVIPSLNEERYIVPLLDSLAGQDYGPGGIEVLIADGGSTDRTRELVQSFPSPFARLQVVDNPRRITAAGLNAGMDQARGDCWIILGAHSVVRGDFVRQSVEALKRTGAACVGGPIETVGHGATGRAIAAAMSTPVGVGNARFRYSDAEGEVDTVPFGCYHRAVWDVVGRFDEDLPAADDDNYNARVREAGGRIVLVPEIRSTYYARDSYRGLARQYFHYGKAKGLLLATGHRLQPRHFAPAAALAAGALLAVFGLWLAIARVAVVLAAMAYAVVVAVGSVRTRDADGPGPLRVGAAIATMHLAYGAGSLTGVLHGLRGRRR